MTICIYCLQNKALSEFNIDHVIPQSFGTFEDNLTLVETVCKECNQFFGDNLERLLARGSFEGFYRFIADPYTATRIHDINRSKRVVLKLGEKGPSKGIIIHLVQDESQKKVLVEPVSQIGLKKREAEQWDYFEEMDIISRADIEEKGYLVKGDNRIKIIFGSPEEQNEIIRKLNKKGFEISLIGESFPVVEPNTIALVELRSIIDNIILRGIAKIGFNYLARIMGKEFALNENFNGVRDFIRKNILSHRFVSLQKTPILYNEIELGAKETHGHLITIGWNNQLTTIYSQISLFNKIFYRVDFCKSFCGVYIPISAGHHFNIKNRVVSRLTTINLRQIVIPRLRLK